MSEAPQLSPQTPSENTPQPVKGQKGVNKAPQPSHRTTPIWPEYVLYGLFFLLLLSGLAVNVVYGYIMLFPQSRVDVSESGGLADEQLILERAQDAVSSAELILSFLQGASVLLAAGAGLAAIFGYRATRDLQELRIEIDRAMQEIKTGAGKNSQDAKEAIEELRRESRNLQPVFTALLQSTQELGLRNYPQAYEAAKKVLEAEKDNPQALYIAGWIELQYIEGPDSMRNAVNHLKRATEFAPESPSICAAYGVALRRQAKAHHKKQLISTEEYIAGLTHADAQLKEALGLDDRLIDLNRESFWGPRAGNARDLNEAVKDSEQKRSLFLNAISYYKKALNVTPTSSYPRGNLALLYLEKSTRPEAETDDLTQAEKYFRETVIMGQSELFFALDYYTMMDVAMSSTILGGWRDIPQLDKGQVAIFSGDVWQTRGLEMKPTAEMRRVSLSGWERLLRFAEETQGRWHYEDVTTHLEEAIEKMKGYIPE